MIPPPLPDPIWVDKPAPLQVMMKELLAHPMVAVDTESNSLHAYHEQVCLIQFSTLELDYVVDPLALEDLSSLGPLFANPAIEKVFHAAEYDLICLKRDFGFSFNNLFDTMVASRILGRPSVGLAAMLEAEFGMVVDKHFQRANWGLRPLTPPMLAYARQDTRFLIQLRNRLKTALIAADRWDLAVEDFQRMCAVCATPQEDERDPFWRISGSQDLEPQQLAVLQELYRFRDEQARQQNRPHFKVLSNQAILEVAQTHPRFIQELHLLPNLSEYQVRKYGRGMLEAVRRGQTAPPLLRPNSPRMDEQMAVRLEALRNWRKRAGQDMGVESDVVLPRDVLFDVAAHNPRNLDELASFMQAIPWRLQHFGPDILKAVNH
jgi:ribonuclease D